VNENHLRMLASPQWAQLLRQHVLPWLEAGGGVGDDVLEIGPGLQDRVFAELLRVLRPGGILVGSEGYDSERTRRAHDGDQFVPVDPEALPGRLEAIGFTDVSVEHGEYDFRFRARKSG